MTEVVFEGYRCVNGTYYPDGTPPEVIDVLERCRRAGKLVLLSYGDPNTGKDDLTYYDQLGRVGRSCGPQKVPILVPDGEIGGSEIDGRRVIKVSDYRKDLYRHPGYHTPELVLKYADPPRYGDDDRVYPFVVVEESPTPSDNAMYFEHLDQVRKYLKDCRLSVKEDLTNPSYLKERGEKMNDAPGGLPPEEASSEEPRGMDPAVALRSRTDEEIRELAMAMIRQEIFTSTCVHHEEQPHVLSTIFMPLALGALSEFTREDLKNIGFLYEYVSKAGPRSINGYPTFSTMEVVNLEDGKKVMDRYRAMKKAVEEA